MNDQDFRRLVADMRNAQRRYFRNRKTEDLEESKALERQVDVELRTTGQQEMFGEERNAYGR